MGRCLLKALEVNDEPAPVNVASLRASYGKDTRSDHPTQDGLAALGIVPPLRKGQHYPFTTCRPVGVHTRFCHCGVNRIIGNFVLDIVTMIG